MAKNSGTTDQREWKDLGDSDRLLLDHWAKCEDITIHFNEMLMSFRLKALGGVSVASGVVIAIAKNDTTAMGLDTRLVGAWLLAMSVVWLALWLIDVGYYGRLLRGAVEGLIELEKGPSRGLITFSTRIEEAVTKPGRVWGIEPRWGFYFLPLVVLVVGGLTALCADAGETANASASPETAAESHTSSP